MPNFFWDETTEDHILDNRQRLKRHIRGIISRLMTKDELLEDVFGPEVDDLSDAALNEAFEDAMSKP